MKSKELLLHFCARSYVNQRLNSTPSDKFSLCTELKQLAGTAQTKATSAPTRRRVQAGCVCQRPGVSAARGSISRTVFCRTAKESRHLRFIHVYRIYHRRPRSVNARRRGAARRDVGQRQHMSWRTTASRPEPATEGREDAEDGDMAEQAARDLHWQQRLHAERLANGISAEDEANYIGRPEGPAAGVAAELRRIDPSGRRQVSADVEQRCAEQGWELEHLGVTIGTVVHGPRLSEAMSSAQISTLNAVLLERKVIFFRGQQGLSEREHIAFAERFGSTEVFPFSVREGAAPQVMPLKSVGPIAGTPRAERQVLTIDQTELWGFLSSETPARNIETTHGCLVGVCQH